MVIRGDHVDRCPKCGYSPPVSDGKVISLYTDGGCRGNPGPSAYALIIKDQAGVVLADFSEHIGEATNNRAEYMALIKGLELCKNITTGTVKHFSDSQLLVSQCSLKFKIRDKSLRSLFNQVGMASKHFKLVTHTWLEREHKEIKAVDRLVNVEFDYRILKTG